MTGPTPAANAPRSRGPRGGGSDTRGDILAAARAAFADRGYTAASLRGIAREAGVDPALLARVADQVVVVTRHGSTQRRLLAAALAAITLTGVVQVWHVGVLAVMLGLGHAFEQPARQAFIHQIVGKDLIRNAVTLNSVMVNAARAVGPAVAGVILALVGSGLCFAINAVSFIAVVASLLALDSSKITAETPVPRAKGQLREGLRYVRSRPALWIPLATMALVGTLTYNFPVTLPAATAASRPMPRASTSEPSHTPERTRGSASSRITAATPPMNRATGFLNTRHCGDVGGTSDASPTGFA